MTTSLSERGIVLVVANPQALQHGSTPRHRFDLNGGTIGSHGASWTLVDKAGRVLALHCEIRHSDDAFCVIDRSGFTRVNDARDPLGVMVGARLSDADVLHIGPYRVTVHLDDALHAMPDASRHLAQYDVSEILNAHRAAMDDLPADRYPFDQARGTHGADAAFQALAAARDSRTDLDPLRALDAAEKPSFAPPSPLDAGNARGAALAPTQPDLASTRYVAVAGSPKITSGDFSMSQSREPTLTDPGWTAPAAPSFGDSAQAALALLQGMDVALDDMDAQAGRALLVEAGQALGAAIRGIAALYDATEPQVSRLAMNTLTLQPIEDNPLRLGQGYPDTVRALFSRERSVVHLSPKAAVEETMTQFKGHQAAIIKGIEAGLDALLQAFSPEVLVKRFCRYGNEDSAHAGSNDWAWRMYTHYYEELRSARQRGFEKLFWEVFAQSYERAVRAEAQ